MMYETSVIGVDPGGTTGLFLWDGPDYMEHHELDEEAFPEKLADLIGLYHVKLVLVEKFIINAHTARLSQQTTALELIGVTKYICGTFAVKPHMQVKGSIMKLASDAKLKAVGWYRPGMGHANDAARHALAGVAKHRTRQFHQLMESASVRMVRENEEKTNGTDGKAQ